MPLVSKFLCYLEAAARRKLAGISLLCQNSSPHQFLTPRTFLGMQIGVKRREGAKQIDQILFEGIRCHFCRALLSLLKPKPSVLVAFHRNKKPQTHPEASLLVPTELGRGVFESLLEHDSKAQLPLCLVNPLGLFTQLATRMEAGQCKCLWFQSSFVVWRQQQGGNWWESPSRARIRTRTNFSHHLTKAKSCSLTINYYSCVLLSLSTIKWIIQQ